MFEGIKAYFSNYIVIYSLCFVAFTVVFIAIIFGTVQLCVKISDYIKKHKRNKRQQPLNES